MLTLFTGLPGNGKTLFALSYVKAKAEKEKRAVFYHNIKGLTLPWTEIKAEEWMNVPDGSIVVLDEAQMAFAPKPNGSRRPEHYEQLAVHRHKGIDLFIITQHPSLLDNFVRRLVGQHFHSVRKFGFDRATIYEWDKVAQTPENPATQKSSVPLKWSFNKDAYNWYKSAELHTVKKRVPVKIFLAAGLVLSVVAAAYYFLQSFDKPPAQAGAVVAQQPSGPVANFLPPAERPGRVPAEEFDPIEDAREYVAMSTPRVEGLPHTAPKYDKITAPVRAPIPAACIQIGSVRANSQIRCNCYSQQGTRMEVQYEMCIHMAQNGWFKDFNEDGQAKPHEPGQQQRSGPPLSSSLAQDHPGTKVLALNETSRPHLEPEQPASEPEGNSRPGRALRGAMVPQAAQ